MKVASLDEDAQKCFTPLCPQELPVPEGHLIADALNQQAALADLRIGVKDAHPANAIWIANNDHPQLTPITGDHVDLYWNQHAVPGTKGFELIDGLPHPSNYDYFIWKGIEPDMHPYGACYHDIKEKQSTGLIEYLKINNVSTVIIGGLVLEYCVKITALQLKRAGFHVIINLPACRSLDDSSAKKATATMMQSGIEFANTIDQLKSQIK